MIIVTGAAGFIGSQMIKKLNVHNFNNIIAVDRFGSPEKNRNLESLRIRQRVSRENFFEWIDNQDPKELEFIFHIGARTDTAEFDRGLLNELNTEYSKKIWNKCISYQIPLIYASSAATYGMGEFGYEDDERLIPSLKPLNPYGESKNEFDKWVLLQAERPFFWAGLKFFNVYGPHEDHKGRMASVIWHAFSQIRETGSMKLFRSHHPDYADGEQKRDFIFVRDVVDVCYFLMHHRRNSGIYNLGTGQARTFLDLTRAVFRAMDKTERINFIDTPEDIRDKYQYFTQAEMQKLHSIGYNEPFTSLEEGVKTYVQEYLLPKYSVVKK
jgi:ADP-L-glycero-D-manno-heptose 6-epimerase